MTPRWKIRREFSFAWKTFRWYVYRPNAIEPLDSFHKWENALTYIELHEAA